MAQLVNVLAAKLDDLSPLSKKPMVDRELLFSCRVTYTPTHTNK